MVLMLDREELENSILDPVITHVAQGVGQCEPPIFIDQHYSDDMGV